MPQNIQSKELYAMYDQLQNRGVVSVDEALMAENQRLRTELLAANAEIVRITQCRDDWAKTAATCYEELKQTNRRILQLENPPTILFGSDGLVESHVVLGPLLSDADVGPVGIGKSAEDFWVLDQNDVAKQMLADIGKCEFKEINRDELISKMREAAKHIVFTPPLDDVQPDAIIGE